MSKKTAANYPSIPGVDFRSIVGFPSYVVGTNGSVWSKHRLKTLGVWSQRTSVRSGGGYRAIELWEDGKNTRVYVPRLVLETFIGPPPNGFEACHNNGIREDNRLENLRWDTRKNNHKDKDAHGTSNKGSRHGLSKLTEQSVVMIRQLRSPKRKQLAQELGVSVSLIDQVIQRKIWRHV